MERSSGPGGAFRPISRLETKMGKEKSIKKTDKVYSQRERERERERERGEWKSGLEERERQRERERERADGIVKHSSLLSLSLSLSLFSDC